MKKTDPHAGLKTAIYLINIGIEQYRKSPTLRKQTRISLVDLAEAEKEKRKLKKQLPK